MPRYRLDYDNPFEMLAHFTDIAKDDSKGLARGSLLVTNPVLTGLSGRGQYYAITPEDMLYLAFIVGYLWEKYSNKEHEFYLHADTYDDLVYFKLKLDSAKAKKARLPR